MRVLLAALLSLHALLHLLGPAKAFGFAELPQLGQPIPRAMGVLWLAAALLLLATVLALFAAPRWWWAVGAVALLASQAVILGAWSDARFGTIPNAVLLVAVAYGFLTAGPFSFRAEYDRATGARYARDADSALLTSADLEGLPPPVRRYVQASGAVGQPRVRNFRARFRGRIRSDPASRWMPFTGEQVNTVAPASRHFLMDATMLGVPVQAFHAYVGADATMRVKAAGLVLVADEQGAEMSTAETVTLLNDLCVIAPGALADARIRWEEVDGRTARAHFENAGHAVSATLVFNDQGDLVDFWSDDRRRASADGTALTPERWSTPLSGYRAFGAHRLAARGEGRWHPAVGAFTYIEFELVDVAYNVGR